MYKRQFKATLDFQWKRINIGANVNWKSKMLAVDYIMLVERSKSCLLYTSTMMFKDSLIPFRVAYFRKRAVRIKCQMKRWNRTGR